MESLRKWSARTKVSLWQERERERERDCEEVLCCQFVVTGAKLPAEHCDREDFFRAFASCEDGELTVEGLQLFHVC